MRSIVLASLLAAATTVVPSLTRPTPTFETEVGIQPTFQAHYPYQWGDPGATADALSNCARASYNCSQRPSWTSIPVA